MFSMIQLVGLIIIGIIIFINVYSLFGTKVNEEASEILKEEKRKISKSGIIKLLLPLVNKYLINMVQTMNIDKYRRNIKVKLTNAGMIDEITPDELYGIKLILGILSPILATFLLYAYGFGIKPLVSIGIGVIGYFYPEILINKRKKERQEDIRLAMPFMVDLLTLSVEAGLDFIGAMGKVIEKAPPSALLEELELVLNEIKIGVTRGEALRHMAQRVNMMEMSSFVSVLVTADRMGTSIGQALRTQSESVRQSRFILAEKKGAAATQKLFIPMMLLILPAIFLVVFSPIIVKFFSTGSI